MSGHPPLLPQNVNPHVSVDCVIFGFSESELKLLLIKRQVHVGDDDVPDRIFALPGNLVREDENLDEAADRVLSELTGLENIYLEQFKAFGDPERVTKDKDKLWLKSVRQDPEARVITVAYFSLINSETVELHPGGFSKDAFWCPVDEVPELAFDHNEIFESALEILKKKIQLSPIGFELLPQKFTMSQLQELYEVILARPLDKRNFRRKMLNSGLILPLSEKQTGVSNKPAQYFKFDRERLHDIGEDFVNLKMEGAYAVLN